MWTQSKGAAEKTCGHRAKGQLRKHVDTEQRGAEKTCGHRAKGQLRKHVDTEQRGG